MTKRRGDKFCHLCLNSGAATSVQFQHKFPFFKYQGDLAKSRNGLKGVYFSVMFSWTSALSDRKVPNDDDHVGDGDADIDDNDDD